MEGQYDKVVIAFLGVVVLIWILYGVRKWIQDPVPDHVPDLVLNEEIQEHPALDLLEREGYEVIGGKLKVPLSFQVNQNTLYSRLFIDYVAEKQDEIYIVKTSRSRMPVEWTGAGLRDRLLPYLLLYPTCDGLLYVDTEEDTVKRITLLDEDDYLYDPGDEY
ncbi:hypothetical protein [Paenibacillus sp. Marseille-Q4541]|uniref:hypothetical protein n=1 Tax=Paenibacillus sp. Marseille-Q4541 TaxID=2831522 RepID=UPI001BAD1A03|nr:hypothetical protein [Paenibacillus sp. Marseille-Q4541]